MISAPAGTNASNTESHNNGGLAGYIFLCNRRTKLECYRNRVFGLPLSKKKVVEEIKPGTKLFLFDFEVKLLYGVYEATSAGNLNLEPAAFGGKFPAQVKFKIFKQCLPLPESSLRNIIKENYTGTKFKQELSIEQVINLISSFRPLGESPSRPAAQAREHMYVPEEIPPEVMENPYEFRERLTRPVAEPQPVPDTSYLEHEAQIRAAGWYYDAHPQPPLFAEDVALRVQEPSCSRYTTVERRALHGVTLLESGHHQLPLQRKALYQNNLAANSNSAAADQYTPSVMQMQPSAAYYQLPLQREALYQNNLAGNSNSTAVDQSTPSVMQTQSSASYHQLPLQREPLYQYNLAANSNSTAKHQHTSSAMQKQPSASYYQLPSQTRQYEYQYTVGDHSSSAAAPSLPATSFSHQQVSAAYLPLQREPLHQVTMSPYISNRTAQYGSSVLHTVHYNQSSLPGSRYQDRVAAYSSYPQPLGLYTASGLQPQVQATYLPPQGQASYQEYNSYPTVPAQYTSITVPQVNARNLP